MLMSALFFSSAATQLGCLVTESPDFSEAQQTPPQLIPILPTTEFIRAIKVGQNFSLPKFEAKVLSEDADQDLTTVLLIDYGKTGADGSPWSEAHPGAAVAAKTLADGPRKFGVTWQPRSLTPLGCHTVTMLVTHAIKEKPPEYWCPANENDFAALTWFVILCEVEEDCLFKNCAITGVDETKYCGSAELQE